METELDMQAIKTYESESSHETYAHEDLKKLLGLWFNDISNCLYKKGDKASK